MNGLGDPGAEHAVVVIEQIGMILLCLLRIGAPLGFDLLQLQRMIWILFVEDIGFLFARRDLQTAFFVEFMGAVPALPYDGETAAAVLDEGQVLDGAIGGNTGAVGFAELFDDILEDLRTVGVDAVTINPLYPRFPDIYKGSRLSLHLGCAVPEVGTSQSGVSPESYFLTE